MENVSHYEQKMLIFKDLLFIDNKESLNQIKNFIDKFLIEFQRPNEKTEAIESESDEFDAKKMTFEEWNVQFTDDMDLNEFIPEYGMTLKEFRLKIYNSERSEGMSKEKFIEKVNQW